ncbi:phage protein [Staphylococcus aureus]|nr:phage protein [Staphylococcus aureus]
MAKEIINNTERFILVQIDKEGTETCSISRFHRKFYNF